MKHYMVMAVFGVARLSIVCLAASSVLTMRHLRVNPISGSFLTFVALGVLAFMFFPGLPAWWILRRDGLKSRRLWSAAFFLWLGIIGLAAFHDLMGEPAATLAEVYVSVGLALTLMMWLAILLVPERRAAIDRAGRSILASTRGGAMVCMTQERLRLLAWGALADLAVCFLVFFVMRQPFLGDKGEYWDFLKFLPRAFAAIWITGRAGTALLTLRQPKQSLVYVLVCAVTVMLMAGWSILGTTGWSARGVGEFPGWQGLGSAADILELPLLLWEHGWKPSWIQRGAWPWLLVEIGLLANLFVFASSVTRRALKTPGMGHR